MYLEPVFRPPSEAESLILQVTYGCSHNKCTFCSMYLTKPFRARPFVDILADIKTVASHKPQTRRVFLADGDAMILKTTKLIEILDALAAWFPNLERVGIYSDARGVLSKSDEALAQLAQRKLGMVYFGLESGSDEVLKNIKKGSTAREMTEAVQRIRSAGIKSSVIALLGVGGQALSSEHAEATARVVGEMSPDYFSALTLTIVPGTPLAEEERAGLFEPLNPEQSLVELRSMLERLKPRGPITFRTNHASNYVPLRGTLPDDGLRLIETIDWALKNKAFRPEWMRGL